MSEINEKANKMGHISKEDWVAQGKNPDEWRSPEEFVERGENIVPIMRDRIDKLEKTIQTLTKHVKTQVESAESRALESAKKQYEDEIERLRAERREAVETGDTEKFDVIDNKINDMTPPEEPKKKEEPIVNEPFEKWCEENPWYAMDVNDVQDGQDEEMTLYAMAVGQKLTAENLPPNKFFKKIEERVKKAFPHKFENENRETSSMAESATHTPPKGDGKAWSDVPSDAKATYKRTAQELEKEYGKEYVESNFTKEIFVKQYFEA